MQGPTLNTPDAPAPRAEPGSPRGVPWWLILVAAVGLVGAAVVCWILAPGWVSPPLAPSAGASAVADEASRRAAVGATRTAIVTGFLGLGALIGFAINNISARAALAGAEAARINAEVAVANSRVAVETLRITERGHLTDRYAKAVEQLGAADNDTVRLGGIYSLQQYAQDSDQPGDQLIVVEVLSAFIRRKLDGVGGSDGTHEPLGADVLAAISVLAHLPPRVGVPRAYFSGALFHSVGIGGARLSGGNLSGVQMHTVGIRGADLSGIALDGADFDNASLTRCNLTGASLRGAIFRTGQLSYSKLHDADLDGADLGTVTCEETEFNRANLRNANLTNANLSWANLSGANCRMANFRGANLEGADLDGALLEDGQLTAKQITCARNVPPGLRPEPEQAAS